MGESEDQLFNRLFLLAAPDGHTTVLGFVNNPCSNFTRRSIFTVFLKHFGVPASKEL